MIQKYGLNERKEIQEEDSEAKVISSEQHEKKTEINVNGISEEEEPSPLLRRQKSKQFQECPEFEQIHATK